MLPTVPFCGLNVTRLMIGANPFGGYSHQNRERDQEMRSYYTVPRILETWRRAEQAGINTMVANNETPHVLQAVREYVAQGGALRWIAQVNCRTQSDMARAIDEVVDIGCAALYIHGALIDQAYAHQDEETVRAWCDYARSRGVPAGVAAHAPEAHLWVDSLGVADFNAVCFFNCGTLHTGRGDRFQLGDLGPAVACIQQIQKPCIGYKIMGAGRIDPRMAFEYAFQQIKPIDAVNVGMYRGDRDGMVEENAEMVSQILKEEETC
ncbi:MAG: hypothetical protein JXA09_08740 [Anaerolineae bacterium]|nr:hypothetical protein [Anaerolineae bacterium]